MKNTILLIYLFLITHLSFAQDILFDSDYLTKDLLRYNGIKYAYQCGKGKIKKITYHLGYNPSYKLYDAVTLYFDKEGNLIKRKARTVYPDKKEKKTVNYPNIEDVRHYSQYNYHYNQDKKISQIDFPLSMDINESFHYQTLRIVYDKNGNILQKISTFEDKKNNSIVPNESISYNYKSDNQLDSIILIRNQFETRIHTKDARKKNDKIITYELDTLVWKTTAKYIYNSENKLQNVIVHSISEKYFDLKTNYEVLPHGKRMKGKYILMGDKHKDLLCFDKEGNWIFTVNNLNGVETSRSIEYYK